MRDRSKWSIVHSAAEFEAARLACGRARGAACVGLAVKAEVDAIREAKPAMAKHVFELTAFLAFVSRFDAANSRSGAER